MVKQKNLREMVFGAMAGSVLGSILSFYPKQPTLLNKARTLSENVLENVMSLTEPKINYAPRHFLGGAMMGLLVGAGSAALLTPRTGKQLRKVLTERYKEISDHPEFAEYAQHLLKNGNSIKKKVVSKVKKVKKKTKRAIRAATA